METPMSMVQVATTTIRACLELKRKAEGFTDDDVKRSKAKKAMTSLSPDL